MEAVDSKKRERKRNAKHRNELCSNSSLNKYLKLKQEDKYLGMVNHQAQGQIKAECTQTADTEKVLNANTKEAETKRLR